MTGRDDGIHRLSFRGAERTFHFTNPKLLHRADFFSRCTCEQTFQRASRNLDFIGCAELFANCSPVRFGNNPVHKVSLSVQRSPVCCPQFIERTEPGDGDRKKVVERFEDNPR